MNRHPKLPISLVLVCLWFLLGNCYFNPAVQLVVNPSVEEEPEAAGAGLLAALATPATPPSPYFFLVSSSPADGQDLTSSLTTFSFTFSETLDIDASNATAWINMNIIPSLSIDFLPSVNISDKNFELSLLANEIGLGNVYTITFGSGVKVKSGKPIFPGTKVTFTCTSGCPAL